MKGSTMLKVFLLLAASLIPVSASAYDYHHYVPHHFYGPWQHHNYGPRVYYGPQTHQRRTYQAPIQYHNPYYTPNFNWHH